jgi:hypothetical protein
MFYTYLLLSIISLSWVCFPTYYNLFHGQFKPQAKDYTPEVIDLWFQLFAPLSLLLTICSIYLIRKHIPNHHSKIFFLFSIISIGITCYFTIDLLNYSHIL